MRFSLLLFGLSTFLCPYSVNAQQGNGHICQNHPETVHATNWIRTSLTTGPTTPVVVPGPETWVVLVDHDAENSGCEPANVTVDVTRSVTHTVTVGGKVTVGGSVEAAAGVLFSKLKATASAQVEVNGSFSDSETETVRISASRMNPPCNKLNYTFLKLKKTATGSVSTFDHQIICKHKVTKKTVTNHCNKVTLTGSATGWGKTRDTWTELGRTENCPCDKVPDVGDPDPQPEPEPVDPGTNLEPVPVEIGG